MPTLLIRAGSVLTVFAWATYLVAPAVGDITHDVPAADAARLVSDALRAELAGDNRKRSELLQDAIREAPERSSARWQSGLLQTDDVAWTAYHEFFAAPAEVLDEYRAVRSQSGREPAGLLKLADWCLAHGLADAERAHLIQVLASDPQNAVARERLGHVPFDGIWISPEDYARTAARQADMAESLKRWGPAIAENVRLLSGVRRQRDRGHDALFAIRDTSAIPAMERLLTNGSETHGLLLIEWLSRLNAYEAGQALARVSLGTPTDRVRREAALALRSRPFDEFMPVLLGALQFPVELQSRTYVNADGWVVLDMLFDSETQDEHRQLQLSTEVGKQLVIMPTGSIRLNGRSYLAGYQKGPDLGDKLAAQRYLLVRERQADQQRLQWNERIRQINERAESSLHIVTENHEPAGPANWWDWWISFNEVHATGVKPTLRVQPDPERVYVQNPDKQLTDRQPRAVWEGSLAAGGQGSCLVAGTPVWTERGLTPVEQVQVGDRVLAQELTSGELAYKPVLATTVRPPVGTFNIAADGITVRATGGHPFWVNGEGWRFARDLKPGMCFHGADGSREIKSVEPAEESEAFNLVVADFHTYFIGDGQILSHDNTPRSPTNALVPGLLREP